MSEQSFQTLGEFIIDKQEDFMYSTGELSRLLSAIRLASKVVNREVNKAGIANIIGKAGNENIQGEEQQKLDVLANEIFIEALSQREVVCGIASEENDDFIEIQAGCNAHLSKYVVLIDPLDGSSNIDVNVSVGTIFSIYRRVSEPGTPVVIDDFLQKGVNQIAAGYVVYGSSTMIVFTTGRGVNGFTLDPSLGTYYLSHPNMQFSRTGKIYSINEGNYIKFPQGVKDYLKYCQMEEDGRPYCRAGRRQGNQRFPAHHGNRTYGTAPARAVFLRQLRDGGKGRRVYEKCRNEIIFYLNQYICQSLTL